MFEIGCLAALDQALPDFRANDFDIYVGTSSGSLVASLVANGVRPEEVAQVILSGALDPYNLRQEDILGRKAGRRMIWRTATVLKTVAKHLVRGGVSMQDLVGRVQQDLPPGFFTLDQLERFLRSMFESKRLSNRFGELSRRLYITAVDLDRAERVIFGDGELAEVPISQAIAASSAIPGFFEPYRIGGRDYIDGGVGHVAHADIAMARGADLVVVINPMVPLLGNGNNGNGTNGKNGGPQKGLKYVIEQSARITSRRLLESGLRQLKSDYPRADLLLIEPSENDPLLFVNSTMSFAHSREAIELGFQNTVELLKTERDRFAKVLASHRPVHHLSPVEHAK
jgi:predicted acylesterase/phospholipase RssA